ncbi:(2Fe-2S) ferredoxin domain-containing protein [Planctomycetota bacterium]|jgi:(2Fe-2S) ferredoxin|nr:(2Fe-2S) ferredoxin domain-containing protein [Planctomycetota bacterium]
MPGYQRMLFVCLNDRGDEHPRGSCAKAGGGEVLDRLRAGIHERGLKGVVRAVGTRCLGQCAHGPVVACQPEEVWYGNVQGEHVDQLIDDHVLGGEVVAALELSEEQLVFVSREERPLPPIQRRKGVAAAPSDQESDPAPGAEGA